MKKILPFIALDLETTGLDTQNDTIIEIAAVKFEILFENNTFSLQNVDERSMLINPGIPLSEEVSLITHITPQMLEGKKTWQEIQQNVADFIDSKSIILGHNVFFDVAMLASHGIDLSQNPILDTFELSEIFSQDASSLNLGFLGDFYNIPKRGQEHRALTDTKIAIDLFLHFLQKISQLSSIEHILWKKFGLAPNSPFFILQEFFDSSLSKEEIEEIETFKKTHKTQQISEKKKSETDRKSENFEIFSLKEKNDENTIIANCIQKYEKIAIITPNKKSSELLQKNLQRDNIPSEIAAEFWQFIETESIFSELENNFGKNRKYDIFLLKMLFWLAKTQTGIVNELKYYGDEFTFLEDFRLQENENNTFREKHEKNLENTNCILQNFHKNIHENNRFLLYKDISLAEGNIRKILSHSIDFEKLIENISSIPHSKNQQLIDSLRIIEAIYLNAPNRPIGENPNPPGKYGETYFLTQNNLWSRGCKWLAIGNRGLQEIFDEWKIEANNLTERKTIIKRQKIISDISLLIAYESQEFTDLGVIITINDEKLHLQFISQNLGQETQKYFHNANGYGFYLEAENIQTFLEQELPVKICCRFDKSNTQYKQKTQFSTIKNAITENKILILTTSMKHIRELGNQLSHTDYKILMQGTSGGKSKITHYFCENPDEKTILIGLIDSWQDEHKILAKTQNVIIAKIPFDPPTDPYFLAKTIGMSNSFEKYSKPIVLSKLNKLIGSVISANIDAEIICSDERIHTTEWGKFVKQNLL